MPPSPTTTPPNVQTSSLNQEQTEISNLSTKPVATNPSEIADFFNTYFGSVFTSENLPVQDSSITDDPLITELNLTELEIPARLPKETASVITPSICKLFNKSLKQGTVPQDWKVANVVLGP